MLNEDYRNEDVNLPLPIEEHIDTRVASSTRSSHHSIPDTHFSELEPSWGGDGPNAALNPTPPASVVGIPISPQFLLLSMCMKREDVNVVAKVTQLVRENLYSDASFVLCVDEDGNTPLHLAAISNNTKICTFLIEETNIRLDCKNSSDQLAIHYAVAHQNVALFTLMVRRSRAHMMTHDVFGESMETLLQTCARVDATKQAALVSTLVLMGADPLNASPAGGINAYQLALVHGTPAAFYLNNYLLNRLTAEREKVKPEDVDDDSLQCRAEKCVPAADGYKASERWLMLMNRAWWTDGASGVEGLVAMTMRR